MRDLALAFSERFRVNKPCEQLQCLRQPWARMQSEIIRIAEYLLLANRRNRRVSGPKLCGGSGIGTHLTIEDYLGADRDNVLKAQTWP